MTGFYIKADPGGVQYFEPNFRAHHKTSYATYDDGWREANNLWLNEQIVKPQYRQSLDHAAVDPFNTLLHNNVFGNKYRFTYTDGLPYTAVIDGLLGTFIDHLTGREYLTDAATLRNWVDSLNLWAGDGFFIPSQEETWTLGQNSTNNYVVNGVTINSATMLPWTGTTSLANINNAIASNNNSFPVGALSKLVTSRSTFWVRIWAGI